MVLLEVAGDALLQVARLAHVEHAAVGVEIAVDARQRRQRGDLRQQLIGMTSDMQRHCGQRGLSARIACAGTSSARSSTTTATSACAGACRPQLARAASRCACGSTMPRRWPGWRRKAHPRRARCRAWERLASTSSPATSWSKPSAANSRRASRQPSPRKGRRAGRQPAWINLEYLSAESYVRAQPRPALARAARARRRAWPSTSSTPASRRAPAACCASPTCRAAPGGIRPRRLAAAAGHRHAEASPARQPVLLRAAGPGSDCWRSWQRGPVRTQLLVTAGRATAAVRAALDKRRPVRRCLEQRVAAVDHLAAAAQPARIRPPAVGLRPQFRARRGFAGAGTVGRQALASGRSIRRTTTRTTPSWTAFLDWLGAPRGPAGFSPGLERHRRAHCRRLDPPGVGCLCAARPRATAGAGRPGHAAHAASRRAPAAPCALRGY